VFWLSIEDSYGKSVLYIASKSTAMVKDVSFEGIKIKKDGYIETQFLIRYQKGIRTIMKFNFSSFTYNAPLTFAIMAALSLFIKNHKRAYTEALLILFLIHCFYVFTSEGGNLTNFMAKNRIKDASELQLFAWQYIWGFLDIMVIRFEPFLIGIYLYLRFSSNPFLKQNKHS
jgi:hypothetical protein